VLSGNDQSKVRRVFGRSDLQPLWRTATQRVLRDLRPGGVLSPHVSGAFSGLGAADPRSGGGLPPHADRAVHTARSKHPTVCAGATATLSSPTGCWNS